MKKKITWIVISSMIALLFCSCSGGTTGGTETGGNDTNSVLQQDSFQESLVSSSETDSEVSSSGSSAESSAETSKEVSKDTSKEASSNDTEESENNASNESSASSYENENSEDGEDGELSDIIIDISMDDEDYEEESEDDSGEQITPRQYIDPLKITVDISDSEIISAGTDLSKPLTYYIKNRSDLQAFYDKYKKSYALDSTDDGLDFNTSMQSLDDSFFEENDAVIIVQSYSKNDEFEIGDVYKNESGYTIDVYKGEPSSGDVAYVLDLVAASKDDLDGKDPKLNILSPGGYITEEGDDDDEIVDVDD